jgi:transcriptional regulator with XRE-family HTH domain
VLLRDARGTAGLSTSDVAGLLDISEDEYKGFEGGEHSPTLPQLEVLAYTFSVPIKHFWGSQTLAVERKEREIKERLPEVLMLRQKMIGIRLRAAREQAGLSQADVADKAGLSSNQLEVVERGLLPLPVTALERVVRAVNLSLDDLVDEHGTVGNWLQAQEQFDKFLELPSDLRDFVCRPINGLYQLAVASATCACRTTHYCEHLEITF